MKVALTVLLATMVVALASSKHMPRDLRVAAAKNNHLALLRARNDAACQNRTKSCASCNSVNVCAYVGSGYTFLRETKCPDSAPYCEEGECVQRPGEACQTPAVATDFTCFDGDAFQGYYPAPFDCTKYYVCSGNVPYVYNCPPGHVYDHSKAACVGKDYNSSVCYTFPCRESAQYLLYQPDEAVYAYCVDSATALVSKCPESYRMNPAEPNDPCLPFCSKAGRFADAERNDAYYECNVDTTSSSRLTEPLKQFCPPGMIYHRGAARCVLDKSSSSSTATLSPA